MKALGPETIELIERYADGRMSDIEARLFKELLDSQAEYRAYYDFYIHLNRALGQREVEAPVWLKGRIMGRISGPKPLKTLVQCASIAACFVAILLFDISIGHRLDEIDKAQNRVSSPMAVVFHQNRDVNVPELSANL